MVRKWFGARAAWGTRVTATLIIGIGALAVAPAAAEAATASASAPTAPAVAKPGPPGKATAVARDHGALLVWTAPKAASGITGYIITATPGGATVRTAAVTSFLVGGLVNGKPYRFTVKAVNAAGTGPASALSAPVTPHASTVPGPATGVHATKGFEQVTVSWVPPADGGGAPLTGYTLTTSPAKATVTATATATSATIAGLTDGTAYRVEVVAVNSAGKGKPAWSASVTPGVSAPAAPASVTAAPSSAGVTVSWSAPPSDGGSPVTGYVVTVVGTPVKLTAGRAATSLTVTGLAPGSSHTFTVAATNATGTGAAATSTPATAGATVAATTVVLSAASLASLTSAGTNGSLLFTSPPAQVTGLTAGDIVVAGTSTNTPGGLLADVTSVTTAGATVTVATVPASLDQALSAGGFGTSTTLSQADVSAFTPARSGVRLLPSSERSADSPPGTLTLSLNTDLYKSKNGRTVAVKGTISLSPTVKFSASISCCVHTASSFTAAVTASASLSITAQESHSISGGFTLGVIRFEPIVFDVAGVPVVILPEMPVKLIANGSVSVGLTAGASASLTVGAQVTTADAHVSAKPVYSRTLSFTPPALYGAMSAAAGVEADVDTTVDGLPGPQITGELWLARLSANTSKNPWWTLDAEVDIGLHYKLKLLDHTFASANFTVADVTVPIAHADGPYQAVTITPNPASVLPGGKLQLHAHVTGLAAQSVTWSAPSGNGTITSGGLYTAPAAPGVYEVTASQRAAGLSLGAVGMISIRVGDQPPGPPTAVAATSAKPGTATVSWTAPADTGGGPVTGYTVTTVPAFVAYPVAGTVTSTTITGLPAGSYSFTVTASGPGGTGIPSAPSASIAIAGAPGTSGGGTWTAPVESDRVLGFTPNLMYPGISCVQPDWCMVVSYSHVAIYPHGLTSFPASVFFSLGAFANIGDASATTSCASRTFCMIASGGLVASWNGTQLIARRFPGKSSATIITLSCPSAGFCAAGDNEGGVYTWQSGVWSAATAVPGGLAVYSASCSSASYCVAVTADSAVVWNGSTWSAPVALGVTDAQSVSCPADGWCQVAGSSGEVLPLSGGVPGTPAQLGFNINSVSCTSPSFCIAAEYTSTSGNSPGNGEFFAWNGSSWSSAIASPGGLDGYSLDVSCASQDYCAAIDQQGIGVASAAPAQQWGYPGNAMGYGWVDSMTCPSATQCMGSDITGNVLTWSGSGWSGPSYANAGQISCPGTTFCASVHEGAFQTWAPGTGWTSRPSSLPSTADGISCASATFCAALDFGDVYFWNGSTWRPAGTVDPSGQLTSIACLSPAWCMAGNLYGVTFRWNGTAWSKSTLLAGGGGQELTLSCPTQNFCLAVGGAGGTEIWNGTSWRTAASFGGGIGFTALSCVSSAYCVAALTGVSTVNGSSTLVAGEVTTWNGTSWSVPVLADPDNEIDGLSCPTTSFCAAGDRSGQVLEYGITG